jgi:N-acetylglucosamine kinase-like BadF-type ATPase
MSNSAESPWTSSSALVLGVDGGGTRTRARLANTRGETVGQGEAGTANPNAHGYAAAQSEILSAIEWAFQDARLEKRIIAAGCLGISGVDRAEERARFAAWARETIAPRVQVVNDGEIVLAAGSPENWGVALIAGTGSIAWGKTRDATPRIARAGGWGHLIGDEGSGVHLAREALRAATHAEDGRGEPTRLLEAILNHWGLASVSELIPRVYRSGLAPADMAQLAPLVVHSAEEGDAVAQRLIERAAAALADIVTAVARQLQFQEEEIPLALTGGLLLEAELLRASLIAELKSRGADFSPIVLVHDSVAGAVRLAIEMTRG